jgi:hypothetical protein
MVIGNEDGLKSAGSIRFYSMFLGTLYWRCTMRLAGQDNPLQS